MNDIDRILKYRSSRLEVFCKKYALKNFAKFTGHECFRLRNRGFPLSFEKFFWIRFVYRTLRATILWKGHYHKNSHRKCSIKKVVLKNFAMFTKKHLCWSLFWVNVIKERLQQKSFPVNNTKFLRTPILKNICERLLLVPYTGHT